MTRRQQRISSLVLAVAFAGLGVWGLIKADYVTGAVFTVFALVWLLRGVAGENLAAMGGRRSSRRP